MRIRRHAGQHFGADLIYKNKIQFYCKSNSIDMPSKRQRKTTRGNYNLNQYENAYEDLKKGASLRVAAEMHGINHTSLSRYSKKRENSKDEGSIITMGYAANRVFTDLQEKTLVKYLIRCYDIYFGLSTLDVRKLAFELAIVYKLRKPASWDEKKLAGFDWFRTFIKRNPELMERITKTNLSKATNFNRTKVNAFYDGLERIMDRYHFEVQDIYNVDEIGIRLKKSERVVKRGEKIQIGSGEEESFLTLAFAANALGNVVPPMFVFPFIRFYDHLIRDGPVGSVGVGDPSGWMQENGFLVFLKHFRKHTKATPDGKVLLILGNHSSLIHINCLDYCKENGIVLLSFPSRCFEKLQPLDRSCHGPFKKAINFGCDAWTRNNPGKTMTIHNIPSIVAVAMPQALTSINICAGFQKTGIFPINRNLFTDLDFPLDSVNDPLRSNNENNYEKSFETMDFENDDEHFFLFAKVEENATPETVGFEKVKIEPSTSYQDNFSSD